MKKCSDCNIEMLDGNLYGKPRFIDIEHDIDKFYVHLKTGEKSNLFGMNIDEVKILKLKTRVCPKCGKVEIYVDLNQ